MMEVFDYFLSIFKQFKYCIMDNPKKIERYLDCINQPYHWDKDIYNKFVEYCFSKNIIFFMGADKNLEFCMNDICDLTPEEIEDYTESEWEALNEEGFTDYFWMGAGISTNTIANTIKNSTWIDAYGGCTFMFNKKKYTMFNTYGEEDRLNPYVIYCICLKCDNKILVADIVWNPETRQIELKNRCTGIIPEILIDCYIGEGKRGFYYYRKEHYVSLRTCYQDYNRIPQELKHVEAEDWISGPRLKITVQEV